MVETLTDIVQVDGKEDLLSVSQAGQLAGVLEVLPAAFLDVELHEKLTKLGWERTQQEIIVRLGK